MVETEDLVISGHVKNNIIVLDEGIQLPDGLKVTIIISAGSAKDASGLCGIWRDDRPVEEIVHEIISARSAGRDIPPYSANVG